MKIVSIKNIIYWFVAGKKLNMDFNANFSIKWLLRLGSCGIQAAVMLGYCLNIGLCLFSLWFFQKLHFLFVLGLRRLVVGSKSHWCRFPIGLNWTWFQALLAINWFVDHQLKIMLRALSTSGTGLLNGRDMYLLLHREFLGICLPNCHLFCWHLFLLLILLQTFCLLAYLKHVEKQILISSLSTTNITIYSI